MRDRASSAAFWPVVAVVCLALSAIAQSAPAADVAGVNVPKVGGVEVPEAGDVPVVGDDIERITDQLPTGPVDDVLSGGGGEQPPAPPAPPPDPGPETPDAGAPADSSPVASADSGAGGGGGGANPGGRGQNPRAGSQSGPGPGPAAGDSRPGRGGKDAAAKPTASDSSEEATLSSRVGDLIAALPAGVLIGLIGLTVIALLMTGRSAWFARATRRLRLQRRTLQSDVGALEAALVPELPESVGGVGVAVAYAPAAGPAAGGDFHDVFELGGGKIGIVLGDVAGSGREALPSTGIVRYTIRAYLDAGLEPRIAIRLADRVLSGTLDGDFVTAVAATFDPATRRLVYSCAGHPQPIVISDAAPAEVDLLAAPPIGIDHASGSRQTTFALAPDSELWLFSDGLIESQRSRRLLGREGLRELLERHPDPEDLLNEIASAGDGHRDDLTACRLRPPETADPVQPFSVEALLVDHTTDETETARFLEACGLESDELEAACERIAAERRLEGLVLIRVSKIDSVLHWRAERVDAETGQPVSPVQPAPAAPIST